MLRRIHGMMFVPTQKGLRMRRILRSRGHGTVARINIFTVVDMGTLRHNFNSLKAGIDDYNNSVISTLSNELIQMNTELEA